MIHNYLRRHEGNRNVGNWSFAPCAEREKGMLFQIMGPGPECDQERVLISRGNAYALAASLRRAVVETEGMSHTIGEGTARIFIEKKPGADHFHVRLNGGMIGDDVTVSMLGYDGLEIAQMIYEKTLQVELDEITPEGLVPKRG